MKLYWAEIRRLRNVFSGLCTLVAVFASLAQSPVAAQQGDVAAVVAGNNRFAFDMYHRLRASETVTEDDGNLIFSPYSISTAVGMVHAGARGRTAQEIADVFHFGLPQERLHSAYGALIRDLNGAHRKGYQLSVANRLWGHNGFTMHQPFLNTTRDQYAAELGRLDFVREPENSRQTINRWVEEQTNDRIKDLIPSGAITPDTRLILTNAIYFNGDWKHAFNKNATQDRPFAVNASEQIRAPTMFQSGRFRYADGGDFQMLEMPYEGDQLSMLIVLPKVGGRAGEPSLGSSSLVAPEIEHIGPIISIDLFNKQLLQGATSTIAPPAPFPTIPQNGFTPGPVGIDALVEFEAGLSPEVLQSAIDNLAFRDINVYLPKFKLETGVKLGETLADMGMPNAFSDHADFLNIADDPLKISEVRHKAFIELDEEGTEAAAATSIEMVLTTCVCQPSTPLLFNADHPFHFLIRDNETGSTLFMGRVARPDRSVVVVPEPSSIVLILVSVAISTLVFFRRRRQVC